MRQKRFVITNRSWAVIEPLLPGTTRDRGVTAKNNRLFLEGVLWKVRVGAPWRDLPTGFGEWNSVFRRFRRWAQRGVFQRIFEVVSGDPAFEITDEELKRILIPAQMLFDREWYQTAWDLFPAWHSDRKAFNLALNLCQQLIEGMMISNFMHARKVDQKQVLDYLEEIVRGLKPTA